MSKLICVECAPQPSQPGRKPNVTPLTGFIGETLEKYLSDKHTNDMIPVRFPLIGPSSHVSLIRGDRDPLDPYLLSVEGELVSKSGLYVLRGKTPISCYTRTPMADPDTLFERPTYMSTYSLSGLLKMLKGFRSKYSYSWIWKLEKNTQPRDLSANFKHIFLEARIYGIDSVITTYAANKFNGVAVEVIYRPQPTKEMLEKGIYILRTCSDLHLFSSSEEYVSYIDGVSIARERSDNSMVEGRYSNFITPKEATSLNRFKGHYEKVLEENNKERSSKSKEKVEVAQGDVPPPKNSNKEERYSFAGTAASVSTSISSDPMYGYTYSGSTIKTNGGS